MKNIRFEFNCQREVPFYGHLCNQYLLNDQYDVTIGQTGHRYFIEAKGEQTELEQLADAIAEDFLISSWLIEPQVTLISEPEGNKQLLSHSELNQEYCQHCQPRFGDNQARDFGQIDFTCPVCHAEKRISQEQQRLTLTDAKSLIATLEQDGHVILPNTRGLARVRLSYSPSENDEQRQKLVICNPNNLNAHFILTDQQVLALSSIEKPLISVRPIENHPRLSNHFYDLCFANSRILVVLCELLRQKGIDWIYIEQTNTHHLARVNSQWVISRTLPSSAPLMFSSEKQPLHDKSDSHCYNANWIKNSIQVNFNQQGEFAVGLSPNLHAATCALHAANIAKKTAKNCAAIYLSDSNPSQIVTMDAKQKIELFFAFPQLPNTGYEIVHQIEQSPQQSLLDKFKAKYPEDYLALLELKLSAPTNNLQSLWAIAAVLLGGATQGKTAPLSKSTLNDFVIATAMRHKGANAPRIDFPLTKGEAHRSLNWCKTLGSVLSFRLADEENIEKLAFGMHDSFADYLCNWIEHLDQNISIKSVLLSGSSFNNELLGKRVSLRLGKNFELTSNQMMDLDGVNIAVGALFLKQRRH